VYVNEDHEGTIICPNCEKNKRADFSKYGESREPLKVKCGCGCLFNIIIESRRYYRKKINIPGHYTVPGSDKAGSIVVEDLSFTGIRFRTRLIHNLQVGETVDLQFVLDNKKKSEIYKRAIVKRVQGRSIGAEFCDLKAFDKELGYYLMPT
jgi:hypothetical protein